MSDLRRITELANTMVGVENEILDLEEKLKEAKDRFRKLAESDLPEAMEAAGMEEFKLRDGRRVTIATDYYAAISKDRSEEAYDWLRENGHGALIKRDVILTFGAGTDDKAFRAFRWLSRVYKNDDVKSKEGVHSQTLRAWVRGQMEAGEDFPQELFGVFVRNVAKINAPGK
jgi:hypothetical protein